MYKGEYSKLNPTGLKVLYQSGDVVLFEGNLYKAQKITQLSPFQDSLAWSFIGKSRLFSGIEPPIDPIEGQQWERDGVVYTYYFDGDNYSWVEF
jgi:hypothetical protein